MLEFNRFQYFLSLALKEANQMVYSESYHDTWEEAEKEGIDWVVSWGFGYCPTYQTYQATSGAWVCSCKRWSSCD